MKRLTADNAFEMDMFQLAFNQVYIKDGWTWYRNGPDDELSACDLIRSAAETLGAEPPPLNDEELSDLLTDWLYYGVDEVEGVLGILYRALWAMAEIRARLSRYEDTGFMPDDVERLAAQEPNTPLTLEELRAKDGEPVWIERCGSNSPEDKEWALVFVKGGFCRTAAGNIAFLALYGIGWLAYRRKPEAVGGEAAPALSGPEARPREGRAHE